MGCHLGPIWLSMTLVCMVWGKGHSPLLSGTLNSVDDLAGNQLGAEDR